jgi:glutathione synthase/RimK-type ligase-like ATP-grasp enzyme
VIVAVTHRGDEHARAVLGALARRGTEAVVLDLADLPGRGRLDLSYGRAGGRKLHLDGRSPIEVERVRSLWWRRPQFPRPPRALPAARAAFAVRQTLDAVMGLVSSLNGTALLVNHPWRDDAAAQKTFQLAAAERAGLRVPATLVTSDRQAVREFLSERGRAGAIHKAVHATLEDWRPTRRVGPGGAASLRHLRLTPVILQERIPGLDVRVTAVGDQLFAAEIDARRSGSPDDYRGHERSCRFSPCRLPAAVERGLRALLGGLGLVFGAADFRRADDGGWYFLEMNPAGQWLFVEERTGQPITEALAAILAARP